MAAIPVPIEFLANRLDLNAIRRISAKAENKEVENFKVDKNAIVESVRSRRKPMNANTTKMPKEFYSNMLPENNQTDKLWSPSDNGNSNGLSKSIFSEEREIPQEKFNTYNQLNEKLNNYKNIPQNNGHSLPFSEEQIRTIIKEEVYKILNDIVKQEGENRLNEEQISIRIGKTIFSGKLTPITKINKK